MRGVSWEGREPASACSHLAHSPLPPRCSREPGMLWKQGERAGSEGSKLGARGASWGLPEAPGTQGPSITFGSLQLTPGTQGCSGSKGSELGVRGPSWEQEEPVGGFLRPMVVGTLKPSITFSSLPLLQLTPARSEVQATW